MKKLFVIAGMILSVAQMLVDSLNQLNLPENSRMKIGAALMLSILILDGVRRYADPAVQTKTLWITVCLGVAYVLGAIAQHWNYLTDLGISDGTLSFIRLGFTAIILTLNLSVKEFGGTNTAAPTKP